MEPGIQPPDAEVVDIDGRLVLPGLVDAHAHLDKTLYGGPWIPHSAQDTLADRIANERRRRGELDLPSAEHMTALLDRMVTAGTAHLRTHTDVDPEVGLDRVEAVRAAAKQMADRISITQDSRRPQHRPRHPMIFFDSSTGNGWLAELLAEQGRADGLRAGADTGDPYAAEAHGKPSRRRTR
jgi:cytosine/adenosine deaminase-related metal-dependent hydrolase